MPNIINGFDEFEKSLQNVVDTVESINGVEIDLNDLLSPSFMSRHSNFSSFSEFMEAGNFHYENAEEFEAIPDESLDAFVKSQTDFETWEDMLSEAATEHVSSMLDF